MRIVTLGACRLQRPSCRRLVPEHRGDFGVEHDIAAYVEGVGDPFEIAEIMVAWGIVMTLMGIVQNYHGLLIARIFLGVTEAGLFPGVGILKI